MLMVIMMYYIYWQLMSNVFSFIFYTCLSPFYPASIKESYPHEIHHFNL